MEKFNATQGAEQESTRERKQEFAKTITELHDYYESHIIKFKKEKDVLWNKHKDKIPDRIRDRPTTKSGSIEPAEFMSSVDAARYQSLIDAELEFDNKLKETITEILRFLSSRNDAKWEKIADRGESGSLSQTNSRHYRSKLDNIYSIEVDWYDYPEDDGRVAETFRESYSAGIEGSRRGVARKWIMGIGKKIDFPFYRINVSQQRDKREFKPSNETEQLLLDLGKTLRERLG